MPPVEHVRLAGSLGCGHISTALGQLPFNPHGYPTWSLRETAALRQQMKAAMREHKVVIGLGEGFAVRPGQNVRDRLTDLDLMAELGAERVSGVCMEPDLQRGRDEFALLVESARERGMDATIEFAPAHPVGNLQQALDFIRHVGQPNFRLVIDAMHFFRSGGKVAELAALDPGLIGYVQVCDVPLQPSGPDYLREAMFSRKVPGTGELPLREFIAALPPGVPIGLEVPMLAQAEAGITPFDRLQPAVLATRALLRDAGRSA
jgi:sugar phosphate isomerase/epimerase